MFLKIIFLFLLLGTVKGETSELKIIISVFGLTL